jgi:hypothetical protein
VSDYSMTTTKYGGTDKRWKRSFHDQVTLDGTLDGALFTPGEEVRSGRVLGRVTATGRLGPYEQSANEVQSINLGAASAGTITIGFDGETTGAIAFNATAADVQAALNALSNVSPGDITVTGGPLPGTITLTFGGRYAGTNVPQVVVTPTGLTGGTVTVATVTEGGSAVTDGRDTAVGHLDPDVKIKDASSRPHVAVFVAGTVNRTGLPAGHGLDAAAEADLPRITYYDGPVS